MRGVNTGDNKWLTGIGLMLATPVIVMLGAVAVVVLATPVIMAITVVVFATVLLWAAEVVTRQVPAVD